MKRTFALLILVLMVAVVQAANTIEIAKTPISDKIHESYSNKIIGAVQIPENRIAISAFLEDSEGKSLAEPASQPFSDAKGKWAKITVTVDDASKSYFLRIQGGSSHETKVQLKFGARKSDGTSGELFKSVKAIDLKGDDRVKFYGNEKIYLKTELNKEVYDKAPYGNNYWMVYAQLYRRTKEQGISTKPVFVSGMKLGNFKISGKTVEPKNNEFYEGADVKKFAEGKTYLFTFPPQQTGDYFAIAGYAADDKIIYKSKEVPITITPTSESFRKNRVSKVSEKNGITTGEIILSTKDTSPKTLLDVGGNELIYGTRYLAKLDTLYNDDTMDLKVTILGEEKKTCELSLPSNKNSCSAGNSDVTFKPLKALEHEDLKTVRGKSLGLVRLPVIPVFNYNLNPVEYSYYDVGTVSLSYSIIR